MTKDEFLKKVTNLRIGGSYNYERSAGFDDCKKQVIEMIAELDIEGLTPETFNMFRETMEAMANRYQELFKLQQQILFLQEDKILMQDRFEKNNIEINILRDFIDSKALGAEMSAFYTKAQKELNNGKQTPFSR